MAFHEVRFPENISFGSTGGPQRLTEIVTLESGFEERNTPWSQSRRRYDAGYGLRSADDLYQIVEFFEARSGQLHGFRWKDWLDHKSCAPSETIAAIDQLIGVGDGSTTMFMLQKSYLSGNESYVRPISKPVDGSVTVAIDGVVQDPMAFAVDSETGAVNFASAPAGGAEIAAGFEFDVPVRFDTDRLDISISALEAGEIPSVPLVEIRQ